MCGDMHTFDFYNLSSYAIVQILKIVLIVRFFEGHLVHSPILTISALHIHISISEIVTQFFSMLYSQQCSVPLTATAVQGKLLRSIKV